MLFFSDNKTSNIPDVEERRALFEEIFSLLETQGYIITCTLY